MIHVKWKVAPKSCDISAHGELILTERDSISPKCREWVEFKYGEEGILGKGNSGYWQGVRNLKGVFLV